MHRAFSCLPALKSRRFAFSLCAEQPLNCRRRTPGNFTRLFDQELPLSTWRSFGRESQMRIQNAVRRSPGVAHRRVRGAALVSALFISLILSLLTAATAVLVTSSYSKSWSEGKSETALQLAEAGVNEEMRYISSRMQQ